MELDEPTQPFLPVKDRRPHVPEKPLVRVVAIEDVHLSCTPGVEKEMNRLYVGLLKFERVTEQASAGIIYRAENVLLRFEVYEDLPVRDDLRPLLLEIPHLNEFVHSLDENAIVYEWQKGIIAGTDAVMLRDPSGNWLGVTLRAIVR